MKCHTHSCWQDATAVVYWPGQVPPPKMCASCTVRAVNIGAAMGFALSHAPLPPADDEVAVAGGGAK